MQAGMQPKFRQTVQSGNGFQPSGTKAALATFGFHLEAAGTGVCTAGYGSQGVLCSQKRELLINASHHISQSANTHQSPAKLQCCAISLLCGYQHALSSIPAPLSLTSVLFQGFFLFKRKHSGSLAIQYCFILFGCETI